jgi:pentatricopeptide repeat protein
MIQLYLEKGDIDKATTMYNRMTSTFNEKVMADYKEYTTMLENAIQKQRAQYKSFSGYAKKKEEEKKDEPTAIGKPVKSRWFAFIFGGFLTVLGCGTLYFLFKNRNKFNF